MQKPRGWVRTRSATCASRSRFSIFHGRKKEVVPLPIEAEVHCWGTGVQVSVGLRNLPGEPTKQNADERRARLASISTRNNSVNTIGVFHDSVATQANWMISFLSPNHGINVG